MQSWLPRFMASLLLGAILPLGFFGSILVRTDGHEPRGICTAVDGGAGTLPLQMNPGGIVGYTCDLNWDLAAFYMGLPALLFGMIIFTIWTLLLRRHAT